MITSDRMAAVDRNAEALGVPRKQLMESSGNAVARAVREVADPGAAVTVLAGRGNNGGDALVAARFLDEYDVSVRLLGRPESISAAIARENWDALQEAEYDAEPVRDSRTLDLGDPDVVVDALLGTGVTGTPREPERSAIEAVNAADATVVAVDVPSGLDADTGEAAGIAVEADRVVTFHDLKPGLADRGDVTVADIGIPAAAERFVGPGDLLGLRRDPASHKGEFGRVFVIGGGPYTGAPALAARAALRAGADLAYVAAPEAVAREIQGYAADLIVEPYGGERLTTGRVDGLLERAAERDVVVLGPGLGDAEPTLAAVREFLAAYAGLAVVDADALSVVPEVDTEATLVCTPHQGELRAMGGPSAGDWRERADAVAAFAGDLGHALLVKGPYDVVSDGDATRVNRTGNPGMTVGGTGDVLAGATGALLAVSDPLGAAARGAYANGRAGDAVAEERGDGLVASDLLGELPAALWGGADD
ncbi:MAG: NAD(P)H-hydrate dehydratase [Halobacteriales archaeon]